jgi:hypothetical protein
MSTGEDHLTAQGRDDGVEATVISVGTQDLATVQSIERAVGDEQVVSFSGSCDVLCSSQHAEFARTFTA